MAKLSFPIQNEGIKFLGIWIQSRPKITQKFGARKTYYKELGYKMGHPGIDIGGVGYDTPIFAPIAGVVRYPKGKGYGIGCYIENKGRGLEVLLNHFSIINVRDGQRVLEGDVLGLTGNTGNSTGPHLHLGIRRYKDQPYNKGWLDPMEHFICWKGTLNKNTL